MTDFDETDRSLLRCTLKKSASTAIAVGKIAICIVAIVAVFFIAGVAWTTLHDQIYSWFAGAFSLLVAIPWWIYAIVGGVGAILLHSLAWCIAREVTPQAYADRRVNKFVDTILCAILIDCMVNPIAVILLFGAIVVSTFGTLVYVAVVTSSFCIPVILLAMGIGSAWDGSAWDDQDHEGQIREDPDIIYKAFRFLPAYYYMVTDTKPKAAFCDPPYGNHGEGSSTDNEQKS